MRTSTLVAFVIISCLFVLGWIGYVDYQNSQIESTSNELSAIESFAVSEYNEELFESLDNEMCCPEEELLAKREQVRANLIEQHGNISEINEFFKFVDKSRNRTPLTPEESLEWHRLLAWFFPSSVNTEAYKNAQWFYQLPRVEGTYSMAYSD